MIRFVAYICLLFFVGALSDGQDHPEVRLEQGVLRGKYRQTWNEKTFNSFTSIPYAQPPVGKLRFKPPVPSGSWDGVLDATQVAPICPQIDIFQGETDAKGDEDCLYLNVYTPQLESTKKQLLPVMFYIHGGGFFIGSGNTDLYGPDILLDKNIVLVTINYRLGALGFLSTEDELMPGNNGLKDQNLALKWVKKNIMHFGGNPEKIIVFGQSAGGASTHYHVLSPLSRDLISGAIAHSGTATAVWSLAPKGEALRNAKRLAEFLNCPNESKVEMIECLSKVDVHDILAQDKKFTVYTVDPIIPFKPVIEPSIEGAFIVEDPIDTIKSGKSAQIPFITGVTTEEGAIRSAGLSSDANLLEELNKNFDKLAPIIFMYEDNPKKDEVSKKIRNYYFGDKNIDDSTKGELTNLFTDSWFLFPQVVAAQLHAKYTSHPVYFYIFGIQGRLSYGKLLGDLGYNFGVFHCDELFSLFSTEVFPDYKPNESERKCIDIMTTIWTTFAETGNPTPATNSLIKTKWEPTQNNILSSYFLKSVDDIKMTQDTYKERMDFWKNLSYDSRSSRFKDEL
ncbi:hypothetical protein ILUMI_03534 [Ignelater luminosus]|uniref:Carboxylic ester hydrolase n=1 Tax=Ignelater luminosus TaxID=2038154 RepID=A0A8K0DBC9_IGNLU|nr:hypothetical protein ILUMI_03534 [Ignelater luminosus]